MPSLTLLAGLCGPFGSLDGRDQGVYFRDLEGPFRGKRHEFFGDAREVRVGVDGFRQGFLEGELPGVEGCDDGNDVDDDGCRDSCVLPACGDGVTQAGEACDDGVANGDDRACLTTCEAASCGDSRVWAGHEACDAGGANDDTGACTTSCVVATCGDGHPWVGVEACDDGNDLSGDGCRADCRKVEACGDALVDTGEVCDDGNSNPADGCDACVATTWLAEAIERFEIKAPGTEAEARVLARVFGGRAVPVSASKSFLGHTLGAAGALELLPARDSLRLSVSARL